MPRSLEARVERLAGPLHRRALAAAGHRLALRARLEICVFVRAAVLEAGLDPAGLFALRWEAETAAELTALGDTPALRAADEALAAAEPLSGDADELADWLTGLARHYADGSHPPAGDSLAAWHAWALLRQAASPVDAQKLDHSGAQPEAANPEPMHTGRTPTLPSPAGGGGLGRVNMGSGLDPSGRPE